MLTLYTQVLHRRETMNEIVVVSIYCRKRCLGAYSCQRYIKNVTGENSWASYFYHRRHSNRGHHQILSATLACNDHIKASAHVVVGAGIFFLLYRLSAGMCVKGYASHVRNGGGNTATCPRRLRRIHNHVQSAASFHSSRLRAHF